MDEQEKLSALLRLKRYEQPGDDFADTFLASFHRYQRTREARRSAVSIWWERMAAGVDSMRRPWVSWAAAGAYSVAVLAITAWPRADHSRTAGFGSANGVPLAALSLANAGISTSDDTGVLPVGFRPDTPETIPGRSRMAAGDRTLHRLHTLSRVRYSPE